MSDSPSPTQGIFAEIQATLEEAFSRAETQARARADEIVRQAEEQAVTIRREAEHDARQRLNVLEQEMPTLRQQLEQAEATLARIKTQFSGNAPAAAPAASSPPEEEEAPAWPRPTPLAAWSRRTPSDEPAPAASGEAGETESPEATLRALREALDALRSPLDETSEEQDDNPPHGEGAN